MIWNKMNKLIFCTKLLLLLHSYQCSPTYECQDTPNPQVHTFKTLTELQQTTISFRTENNWVDFSVDKIPYLVLNSFITQDSNFIRKLILAGKYIQNIDKGAFLELYCVTILQLQNNMLTELNNNTLEGLVMLQELNISKNKINTIPSGTFAKLKHLLVIDLSHNQINNLESDSFAPLSDLWELHLEHNNLVDIPSNMFLPLQRLRWLFLSNNRLSVPTTPEFTDLDNLYQLDLSDNGIAYIYESMFTIKKLENLDLSGNYLTHLNIRNLRISLPSLKQVGISRNLWQCSELLNILKSIENYNMGVVVNNKTEYTNFNMHSIGCNGSFPTSTSTTTDKPSTSGNFPDDIHFFDDSNILEAIGDLKSIVVVFIVVVIVFSALIVLVRTNTCTVLTRRRGNTSFQEDPSLPLLTRNL